MKQEYNYDCYCSISMSSILDALFHFYIVRVLFHSRLVKFSNVYMFYELIHTVLL